MINPTAPSITASVPIEHVGAVDEFPTPTPELHAEALSTLCREPLERTLGELPLDEAQRARQLIGTST